MPSKWFAWDKIPDRPRVQGFQAFILYQINHLYKVAKCFLLKSLATLNYNNSHL